MRRLGPSKDGRTGFDDSRSDTEKFMKCPACPDTVLVMSDRQGVEVDGCPHCRGVWLDRGELDKLNERAISLELSAERQVSARSKPDFADSDSYRARGRHANRKKSWLSEIFD